MAQEEQVRAYQRTTKGGQVITVHAHQRTGADVAATARALPGRPPIAAKAGSFPGGRSVPNVFVIPPKTPPAPPAPEPPKPGEPGAPITVRKSPKSPTVERVISASAQYVTLAQES